MWLKTTADVIRWQFGNRRQTAFFVHRILRRFNGDFSPPPLPTPYNNIDRIESYQDRVPRAHIYIYLTAHSRHVIPFMVRLHGGEGGHNLPFLALSTCTTTAAPLLFPPPTPPASPPWPCACSVRAYYWSAGRPFTMPRPPPCRLKNAHEFLMSPFNPRQPPPAGSPAVNVIATLPLYAEAQSLRWPTLHDSYSDGSCDFTDFITRNVPILKSFMRILFRYYFTAI